MSTLRLSAPRAGRPVHQRARLALLAAALLVSAFVPSSAPGQSTGEAVEYYHAGFDHYFITARANEIGLLDGGAFGGVWRRTGQTIPVWTAGGPDTAETCRFFTEAYPPKSSHFYTSITRECADLAKGTPWQFEDVAFYLKGDALGNCPAGSAALYRLYNQVLSGAPNHRYTTSRAIFDQMVAQGWKAEGAGSQTVFACVPSTAHAAVVPSGWFEGTWSGSGEVTVLLFDDGSFVLLYAAFEAAPQSVGLIQGSATFEGNAFASGAAREYTVLPTVGEAAVTVSGTVVPRTSFTGTIEGGGRTRAFSARYEHAVGEPVALAAIAGQYSGIAVLDWELGAMTVTLAPSGELSGFSRVAPGCPVTGTLVPRLTSGFMEAAVTFGGLCAEWGGPTTGIAYYNATGNGELLIVTREADGHNAFVFNGNR